jgi:hypothetical protein
LTLMLSERLSMLNDDVPFVVNVNNIVLNKDELAELVSFLRSKKFLHKDYKGGNKGFAGGDYDFSFVKCDEKNKVEIAPINEPVYLYLTTFGKEK